VRKKRVRIRGGGTALRCAKYGSRRSTYRRKRKTTTRRRRRSARKPWGMARRGSKCVRMKRVRIRGRSGRGRKTAMRCAKYRAR
jgi:NADPH-dependent glutamate synthase beta subunit-like oxidoreductase